MGMECGWWEGGVIVKYGRRANSLDSEDGCFGDHMKFECASVARTRFAALC